MLISVKATPKSKENKIELVLDNSYKIKVTAAAENNKANLAIINLLAKYFKVKKSQIILITGSKSRQKVFEIKKNQDS